MEHVLETYGYWAILIGTFLEGETIVVLGAIAAQRGHLELPWVMLVSFIGSVTGDQLWFFLARRYGSLVLQRRPKWAAKTQRALVLLEKYSTLFVLGFRFLYGVRAVASFAIGLTGIPFRRFLVLNIIGAAIWAVTLSWAGYLFGHVLTPFFALVKEHELTALGIALLTFLFVMLWRRIRARRTVLSAKVADEKSG